MPLRVSRRRLRRLDRSHERSDTLDLDRDHVARLQELRRLPPRADAVGRSRRDDVAWVERSSYPPFTSGQARILCIPVEKTSAGNALLTVVEALRRYDPERIYVFGSWARGEADELSDLDLVVIKRTTTPFLERLREVARLLPAETGGVDILVYTPDEFETMRRSGNVFEEMIAEEGQLVYERQTDG